MVRKDRQSNIELLRLFTIIGVIVLHYNNPGIGGGLKYVESGSLNAYILYFLESLFACAVNLFIIISGYFMCDSRKRNLWRPIELIVQVILFQEAVYIGKVIFNAEVFSAKALITCLLPLNYFVILYCVIYIISPWINVMLDGLSEKNFRVLMIVSITLFAIYPTFVDVLGELRGEQLRGLSSIGLYGSQWGYTSVNFLLMYLIGAYLKKGKSKIQNWKTSKLIICLIVDVLLLVVWAKMNDKIGFFTERSAWEYCNPFIIFPAACLIILFSRLNLGTNKIINRLAEGVFTAFLLHSVFLGYISIGKFVTGNSVIMILHIFGCAVIIYLVCWLIHVFYHVIMDRVFRILSARIKLPTISI